MPSRRGFLKVCGALAAVAVLPVAAIRERVRPLIMRMTYTVTIDKDGKMAINGKPVDDKPVKWTTMRL